MVSMKDIAKRCGVSVATVSKALNGHSDIGEETRSRICAVADEMGYLTNAAARASGEVPCTRDRGDPPVHAPGRSCKRYRFCG